MLPTFATSGAKQWRHAIGRAVPWAVLLGSLAGGAASLPAEEMTERIHETARGSAPSFTLYFENDAFSGSDRHYTNGLKLSYLSREHATWNDASWRGALVRRLPLMHRPETRKSFGFALGQSIYTPLDITRNPPDPTDRPYAGWTYLELTFSSKSSTVIDTWSFQAGIVGPHSYAEDVQRWIHEWLNDARPAGWDAQLADEPGFNLVFERKSRAFALARRDPFGADVVPHFGISLGNVQTYLNAGAVARVGWNLPNDFGIDLIRAAGGSGPVDGRDLRRRRNGAWSIFVFGGVDGRAVARDLFLDGNTFQSDSPRVDKEGLVGDAYYGVGIIWRHWQLTYTHVSRSPEFEGQVGRTSFGSVTVSQTW